ncbi:MAG: KaiA-binding protein [Euryarchaeota archaeon RBG_13_61_15]|nr:MAG: KaiA-binding protein [Euryarchaeota archaeon RBG_13_61_15]
MPFPRLNSGIPGLDDMIEGGFPFPSVILVAGSAGSGKTTFAQKYLFSGAEKGEQGLFISTLSEPAQWMLRYTSQFEFARPEFYGKEIVYYDLGVELRKRSSTEILDLIDKKVAEVMPQRIVIDPITVVGTMMKDDYRPFAFDLTTRLKNWQAVTLLTGEVRPGEMYPAEISYAVDGVILLMLSDEGDARRKYIEVLKMRGTNHLTGKQSVDITRKDGVIVLKARF